MPHKRFRLSAEQIRPIAKGCGACLAADTITVDGRRVGYMYREQPDPLQADGKDSGWRFMAGDETRQYVDDAANWNWYDVNTIANYDPEIVPLLSTAFPVAFARDETGRFVQETFEPDE
jgi:hypothetical protein